MREVFAAIDAWDAKQKADGAGWVRPRIHLMRAQSQAHLYPVDSSDSTTLAVNHRRTFVADGSHITVIADRINGKIQASAGPAAEHQIKRPLLEHLAQAAWEVEHRIEVATMMAIERGLLPASVLLDRPEYRAIAAMIEKAPCQLSLDFAA